MTADEMLEAANVAIVADGGRPLTWDDMPSVWLRQAPDLPLRSVEQARELWARHLYA